MKEGKIIIERRSRTINTRYFILVKSLRFSLKEQLDIEQQRLNGGNCPEICVKKNTGKMKKRRIRLTPDELKLSSYLVSQ